MKEIIVREGEFELPKEYLDLFKEHKQITIRFPWVVQTQRLLKTNVPMNCQNQMWFRRKGKDKPYVPEGFMEINKERFRVILKEEGEGK
jgi:hypothetical protein